MGVLLCAEGVLSRLLKKAHLLRWRAGYPSAQWADGCGAATYVLSTPRASHPAPSREAAGHLDLFKQPGRNRVVQHPARCLERREDRQRMGRWSWVFRAMGRQRFGHTPPYEVAGSPPDRALPLSGNLSLFKVSGSLGDSVKRKAQEAPEVSAHKPGGTMRRLRCHLAYGSYAGCAKTTRG